ncbi:MAG: Aminopeptidase YpdF [Alphaproteobacteria bacterium MarineAlpha11_Bin1]|nr:MAG: Aminopeptidase YpdF [Alphaproteobacteria bacterium MarineAlpha11_Bin1]
MEFRGFYNQPKTSDGIWEDNKIDENLIEGLAASAFNVDMPDAEDVLVEIFGDNNVPQVVSELLNKRELQMESLGALPAPSERLAALRQKLVAQELDGFLVPLADEHQGEFIASRSQRLSWISGFGGSAGMVIVMLNAAAIFIDGRYTLQVRSQVDTDVFVPEHVAETPPDKWIRKNVSNGAKIGFDPWLHTPAGIDRLTMACSAVGAQLLPLDANPVDAVWQDQPPLPLGPIIPYPEALSGQSSAEKCCIVAQDLKDTGVDAAVLSAPDSIAWLLNIRGCDVFNTPLALSYATIHQTGEVDWYVDKRKLLKETRASLGSGVTVCDPTEFSEGLSALGRAGKTVRLDSSTIPEAVRECLLEAGADVAAGKDPCVLPKARKNTVEIAGARQAHIRDGVALTSFLAWLATEAPKGGVTELTAAARLREFRASEDHFRGLSFETISGSGPNGAIVHYRVTPETDRTLEPGDIYLIDSGAQYLDGTTDVTRSVFIDDGNGVSAEIRDRFTRVLKGHIAIATARFPAGTHGSQIDALARIFLWEVGLDFDHGTGHGVGAYLGVHEGPQRISKVNGGAPIEIGMILSNEPGYYEDGAYGIRIENLVVAREIPESISTGERKMLDFETITLAPIDRDLIDAELLADDERAWLNAYHVRVRETLSPLVADDVREWLEGATTAI